MSHRSEPSLYKLNSTASLQCAFSPNSFIEVFIKNLELRYTVHDLVDYISVKGAKQASDDKFPLQKFFLSVHCSVHARRDEYSNDSSFVGISY